MHEHTHVRMCHEHRAHVYVCDLIEIQFSLSSSFPLYPPPARIRLNEE